MIVTGPTSQTFPRYTVTKGYEVFGKMPIVGIKPAKVIAVVYRGATYTVTGYESNEITLDRELAGGPVSDAVLYMYGRAVGKASHVEGGMTAALGDYAHAQGQQSLAGGLASHAEGVGTIARNRAQHVGGEFNAEDPSAASSGSRGTFAEIIGNGTSDSARSNARTLDWSGNEWLAGTLTAAKGINLSYAAATITKTSSLVYTKIVFDY